MTTESTLTIALNEARAEITQLLTEVWGLRDEVDRQRDYARTQRERIAELEAICDQAETILHSIRAAVGLELNNGISLLYFIKERWITDAQLASGEVVLLTQGQIDAAWAYANDPVLRPFTRKGAELALKELDIERCPDQHCANGEDTRPMPCSYPACKVCNGKGWVKT